MRQNLHIGKTFLFNSPKYRVFFSENGKDFSTVYKLLRKAGLVNRFGEKSPQKLLKSII
jgi:hypothetical protein